MTPGPTAELDDEDFQLLYGPWQAYSPAQVAALLTGAPFRWWVAGGWAIKAAGGDARNHADIDVAVLAQDLTAVREELLDFHLWEAHDGSLRPLRPGDTLWPDREQLWARRDSGSPWVLDILLTPTIGEEWVFKRDSRIRLPLDEIGRTVNGVPYLRPEIGLLHKAGLDRDKDRVDLAGVLPRLGSEARQWLVGSLKLLDAAHPWLARIT